MLQKKVKYTIILLLAVVLIFFVGFVILNKQSQTKPNTTMSSNGDFLRNDAKLTINGITISVEIADTDETRAKGLSGKTRIADDEGMLFTSDFSTYPTFWMKDMLIPLDFIWINKGVVVDLTENVPQPIPDTPENRLLLYRPKQIVNQVLEVNAGFVANNKIKTGDKVEIN